MKARRSLLCIFAILVYPLPLAAQEPAQTLPAAYASLAREILKELVETNTTLKVGSTRAAEEMAHRLLAEGFPADDVILAGPGPRHQNLVVRYRGNGTSRPILFICHLDVVEARRKDWSVDPFHLLEQDRFFYGRGKSDIKDEDADLVTNLIRLRREKFVPDRDIIVALTEDEEGGKDNGVEWLVSHRPELVDAEYCINPDGGSGDSRSGKNMVFEFQTSEKLYMDFCFEVKNKGGHSSLPEKENAIYRLSAALLRLEQYSFPIRVDETSRMFFARSAGQETGSLREDMLAVGREPLDTAAALRVADASTFYNALLRTTCIPTMLHAGHAENALPQTARANVNCRIHPGDTPGEVLATLKRVVDDTLVAITPRTPPAANPASAVRRDVFDVTERTAHSFWPDVVVTPTLSTGASDGRILREKGMPVFGISGVFIDVDDVRAHGKDERIRVSAFYEGVQFMYELIKALSSH